MNYTVKKKEKKGAGGGGGEVSVKLKNLTCSLKKTENMENNF